MNVLRLFYHSLKRADYHFVIQRRKQYWTRVMKGNLKYLKLKQLYAWNGDFSEGQKHDIKNTYSNTKNFSLVFHRFYTMAIGVFSEKYIPDALYYCYIDPYFNNWEMAKYIDHKGMYRNMFPGAKQPKMLAYRMNGFWYTENGELTNVNSVRDSIMISKPCFVKLATDSEGGHGITFVDPNVKSGSEILKILNKNNLDIVVQEGIVQSPTLSAINKNSVNTIRLITLLKRDGTVKIYSVVLRMGIGESKVDNASSGGITVGVRDDGTLKPIAFSAKGERFETHPTSNVHFEYYKIPNFETVKQTVITQAQNFPHFRLVSWDIALDYNDNPVIIEANLKYGEIDFHQLNNGPLFGEDTSEILKEVFGN